MTEAAAADTASTTTISGATILTTDGLYFDFADPDPACFTLHAIARGLANTCRFAGQCTAFYSVAEHSIWVSRLVPPEFALAGLFHDAAEAFIGDMPKPLKHVLGDYQAVEARIESVMFPALGLPWPIPAQVKHADRVMLATEQRQLMRNRDAWRWTDGIQPADIDLDYYGPATAFHHFVDRAHQLGFPA